MYLNKTQFARYQRQWRFLSKQLKKLTEKGQFQSLAETKKAYLIGRLKSLFQKMLRFEKASSLKKALGAAVLLLGLQATPLQAQVNFAPLVEDPFGLEHSGSVDFYTLADIDNDGDLDIVSITYGEDYGYDKTLTLIENASQNEGTEANFMAPVYDYLGVALTTLNVEDLTNPILGDIDNDGDLDLFIGAYDVDVNYEYQGRVVYFENTGDASNPVFAEPSIDPFGIDLGITDTSVLGFADIDGDGDLDLFNTSNVYDYDTEVSDVNINFLENTGTPENPIFGEAVQAPFGLPDDFEAFAVYDIGDIDNDGDLDMIAGGFIDFYNPYAGTPFTFFENTGDAQNPQFGEPQVNPFSLESLESFLLWPHLADLDNDGDLDILTDGGYDYEAEIATWTFHENLLDPVVVKEPVLAAQATVFPTVSNDFVTLNVETETVQPHFDINVFDVSGELINYKKQASGSVLNEKIDVSTYPAGQYLIQVRTPEGVLVRKFVKQ